MEFRLDWEKGTNEVGSIFYRPKAEDLKLPFRDGVPQNAIYAGGGATGPTLTTATPPAARHGVHLRRS